MAFIKQPEKILITIDRKLMEEYKTYYFKLNPRCRTFPFLTKGKQKKFLYGVLSLNDLLNLDPMAVGDKKKKWKMFGVWVAQKYKLLKKGIENSTIEYVIYSETKAKKDLDNLAGGIKFLNDGLYVESKMFIDDNYNHINPLLISGEYDKEHPRTEIRITVFDSDVKDRYEKVKQHIHIWEDIKEVHNGN